MNLNCIFKESQPENYYVYHCAIKLYHAATHCYKAIYL